MQGTSARVIATLIALLTVSSSLFNIFTPESQIAATALTPESVLGWSNFRVGMGAPFLMSGLFAAVAAWKAKKEAFVPIIAFFGCVVFARIVGFASEGVDPQAIRMTTLAFVILVGSAGAYALMKRAEESANA